MPLPVIVIAASTIAGIGGLASARAGAKKMHNASKEMKSITAQHENNQRRFNNLNQTTTIVMDNLGKLELEICESFESFAELIERIQNRPEFDDIKVGSFSIPRYDAKELKDVSVAAGLVVGAISGAGTGAMSGVAAAIAAKGAIGAICVASTGTPIAALHGIAATNAIMAVLGGGTLAAGGGGIALGATVLSAATAGVGILVGGIIFNLIGGSLSGKVDEARGQMLAAEKEYKRINAYLSDLSSLAMSYHKCLQRVYAIYLKHMERISHIVYEEGRSDWLEFTNDEKLALENLVLLVAVLYGMCKTNLVVEMQGENSVNEVNREETRKQMDTAEALLQERGLSNNGI